MPAPEGPEDVDPAHLAVDSRCELLLKDPGSFQIAADGDRIELAPDPRWLTWAPVPLIADPAHCAHGFTVCSDCADEWGSDYYVRFYQGDVLVYTSGDHPG